MKRVLLVAALLVVACTLVFAAPAFAFYAPQPHTAYISFPYDPGTSWSEWAGPSDPLGTIDHSGPIPKGWNVVMAVSIVDTRLGATLTPGEVFHTMAVSRATGCPVFTIKSVACALRYWSPPYAWDPVGEPGLWGRDWWVSLGKLPPGDYSGWVREFAPRAFPSWLDPDTGAILPLKDPVMIPAFDETFPVGFSVR